MWFLWKYHYGILFVVISVFLRGSGPSGGIGEMLGYRYCMWVEYRVVWFVRVFALCPLPLSSRYTTSSIRLHMYVHGRTIKRASTATIGHAFPQEKPILLCRIVSAGRCGSSLNGTSVDVRM